MKYGITNFIKIAKAHVDADTSTLEGIQQKLVAWYCLHFGKTPNDPSLLDMTLEELLVLFQMHRVRNNPEEVDNELNPNEYENWLKKEMGESYLSDEDMVAAMEKEEQEFQQKVREKYPDKIRTDFSQFSKG